ncbi:MAG: hypothetical protein ACJ74O_06190 [Frankiaceae bacterium]
MTPEERNALLAELLEARDDHTTGPELSALSDDDRDDILSLLAVADLLSEVAQGAPPLEADPVAAMLGLIPDGDYALDPQALKRARQAARLTVGALAEHLTRRGWLVHTRDVFNWENRSTAEVAPAMIRAIAEELGCPVDRLVSPQGASTHVGSVLAAIESLRFRELAERWAKAQRTSVAMAASTLKSRLLTTVHRGEHPDVDQMLAAVEALVTAMEAKERHSRES